LNFIFGSNRFESEVMPIEDKLSYSLIGVAMAVHRELGPGLDESFYHELMTRKLRTRGIAHEMKPRGQLIHRGIVADEFEADLIVEQALIAELKVLWGNFAPDHLLQLICYLKFWRLTAGLLFDFGKESLVYKRVPFVNRTLEGEAWACPGMAQLPAETALVMEFLSESFRILLTEHGLGYRDTTYRGLLYAELTYRGIECVQNPVTAIRGADGFLGEARLGCLVLPGQCALLITALRDSHHAADRAVLQSYLRHLELPWGLHVNFGKIRLECQFVNNPCRFESGGKSSP
jgi:GxxExxY protein